MMLTPDVMELKKQSIKSILPVFNYLEISAQLSFLPCLSSFPLAVATGIAQPTPVPSTRPATYRALER